MLLGPNPGEANNTLIRGRSSIVAKNLVGFRKLSFVVKYENRLSEQEFD